MGTRVDVRRLQAGKIEGSQAGSTTCRLIQNTRLLAYAKTTACSNRASSWEAVLSPVYPVSGLKSTTIRLREGTSRKMAAFSNLEIFWRDARYGARMLRRNPSFAAVVVLTLALGIGANTAIFSVVDSVLLKPLPYPSPERLVWLGESHAKAEGISVTWGNFRAWQKYNRSFEDMAAFQMDHFTLTGRQEPLFTRAGEVTSDFFGLVGTKPVLGRVFTDEEDRAGAPRTVVLDHSFWLSKLGGETSVLGTTLALNGQPYRVVGVLPPGLQVFSRPPDFYMPLGLFKKDSAPRTQHGSIR